MTIEVNARHGYVDVVVEADNVALEESVSETRYGIKEDGKKDYNKSLGSDITDDGLKMFLRVAKDLIYYRKAEYDSSDLINQLLQKMPEEERDNLLSNWIDG